MEPSDPHKGKTVTLKTVDSDTGDVRETEITAAQALDLNSGKAATGFVHDEQTLMDDDGRIVHRDSIAPVGEVPGRRTGQLDTRGAAL